MVGYSNPSIKDIAIGALLGAILGGLAGGAAGGTVFGAYGTYQAYLSQQPLIAGLFSGGCLGLIMGIPLAALAGLFAGAVLKPIRLAPANSCRLGGVLGLSVGGLAFVLHLFDPSRSCSAYLPLLAIHLFVSGSIAGAFSGRFFGYRRTNLKSGSQASAAEPIV